MLRNLGENKRARRVPLRLFLRSELRVQGGQDELYLIFALGAVSFVISQAIALPLHGLAFLARGRDRLCFILG